MVFFLTVNVVPSWHATVACAVDKERDLVEKTGNNVCVTDGERIFLLFLYSFRGLFDFHLTFLVIDRTQAAVYNELAENNMIIIVPYFTCMKDYRKVLLFVALLRIRKRNRINLDSGLHDE